MQRTIFALALLALWPTWGQKKDSPSVASQLNVAYEK